MTFCYMQRFETETNDITDTNLIQAFFSKLLLSWFDKKKQNETHFKNLTRPVTQFILKLSF